MLPTLDIRAPADQTEGTRSQVLRWLKAIGDAVTEHEPLIEIETDKVTVEVPAPASGVLREILKPEQAEIEPGDVLGRLEPAGTVASDGAAPVAALSQASEQPQRSEQTVSSAGSREPLSEQTLSRAGAHAPSAAASNTPGTLQRLSPAVRRLLAERNLDPSVIRGTGEDGRITIDDVLAHTAPSRAPANGSPDPSPAISPTDGGSVEPSHSAKSRLIPHTAVRKRIANHMVQSLLHTAPHVTTVFEADLSAVIAHRAEHRSTFEQQGAPLTFTAYFLSAIVHAIRAVPEANSRWTDSALEIYDDIHIGVATAIEGTGLVVPVLRNVESLDLMEIARDLHNLVTAAREGRLAPSDVRGGTFTISNHGVSGSLLATPIVINQPQSAILGVGKMEKRPVVMEPGGDEKLVIRPKCYVTLTIDHRVMDGHQANQFLQTFVRTLETWPAQ